MNNQVLQLRKPLNLNPKPMELKKIILAGGQVLCADCSSPLELTKLGLSCPKDYRHYKANFNSGAHLRPQGEDK